jgi:hypothetical protein
MQKQMNVGSKKMANCRWIGLRISEEFSAALSVLLAFLFIGISSAMIKCPESRKNGGGVLPLRQGAGTY